MKREAFQTNKLEAQVHTPQKTQLKVVDVPAHNTRSAFKIVFILKWGDKVAQSNCLFLEIAD